MANRGIGRGLAALLPATAEAPPADLREIPTEAILPNPAQPRSRLDPESIKALAASVSDTGVIQPLIVRGLRDGRYELIAGERRWRAAREAGLASIPAVVRSEEDGDASSLQMALIENVAREDLNPVDEARACTALIEDLGVSKEELGRRLGRSRAAISNLVRILDLPQEALALLESGELSEGHGRAILQAQGNDTRRNLAREAARHGWSVRETERRAKGHRPARRLEALPHPDEAAAIAEAEEALERTFGHAVTIRATRRGARAELRFDSLDDLMAFARSASGP